MHYYHFQIDEFSSECYLLLASSLIEYTNWLLRPFIIGLYHYSPYSLFPIAIPLSQLFFKIMDTSPKKCHAHNAFTFTTPSAVSPSVSSWSWADETNKSPSESATFAPTPTPNGMTWMTSHKKGLIVKTDKKWVSRTSMVNFHSLIWSELKFSVLSIYEKVF